MKMVVCWQFVLTLQPKINQSVSKMKDNMTKRNMSIASAEGLYRADYEHDACGVGMVVNVHGGKSHQLVDDALKVLENMRHRGAEVGKDGDGAGIMVQIPHEFILLQGIPVPEKGKYGTGLVFLPKDEALQQRILSVMIDEVEREGLQLMHLRQVPVESGCLGESALATEPDIRQVFVTGVSDDEKDGTHLEQVRRSGTLVEKLPIDMTGVEALEAKHDTMLWHTPPPGRYALVIDGTTQEKLEKGYEPQIALTRVSALSFMCVTMPDGKVRVMVSIFGRETPVELSFDQVTRV